VVELGEYAVEPLRKDEEFILYRGHHRGPKDLAPASILLLAPVSARPAPETVKKIEHEYSFRSELDATWAVRPLSLSRHNERTVLVLEDPGGEPLNCLIHGPMEMRQFLRIATGLATANSQLHMHGLIHKDLKPTNVLVNPTTGAVWLTGFGVASRLPRERQSPKPPEFIAGTLAYMAPEQTGRMNRSIDSRSDLYAVGATLYEMLTGSLPFTASDPMEWVHCHVARQPTPPGEQLKSVPGMVSAIIMKLLAKTAEERYQTAVGLECDLRRCLEEWETQHRIGEFPLGEHDTPDRLLIPEKLYGRESEIKTLLAAFDRIVVGGRPELVLVAGYSGIGKSSVVNELHKALVPPRGLFVSGKFDQYKRDIPYAPLATAFQGLIRSLLSKTEEELSKWRDALHEALDPHGQLLVELVPELKLVIGEQPAVPELSPRDAQNRFQQVFRRFIGVFARPEHPLAVFLDDLQWLDTATLDLIEDLLTQPDVKHLLLIGAYRDNEVGPAHPLMSKLGTMRRAGVTLQEIVLGPLTLEDIQQFIEDSVHCEPDQSRALAALVHERTTGNPFFAIQFLSEIAEEGLLTFNHAGGRWTWDLGRIRAKDCTDNVVDLLVSKFSRMPADTQDALKRLACLGNSADFTMLRMIYQDSNEDLERQLWEAVLAGLVLRSEDSYRFLHDRVQEAAYSLIPQQLRAETHLRIGRLLAERTPSPEREETIFEIANHFNHATHLISSNDERRRVAELNLIAATRAKRSIAYASALSYLATGRALLTEESWNTDYDLVFSLEHLMAECELLTADMESAEKRLSMLAGRAKSAHDLSHVTCLQLMLYTALERLDRGVEICLEYLRLDGTKWAAHPSEDDLQREYDRIWSQLGERTIEELFEAPLVANPDILDVLDVLTEFLTTAIFFDQNLCAFIVCRMMNLSLEHGNSDASCFAYVWFGILGGPRFGNYERALRFGQLGYNLMEKHGLKRYEARICLCFESAVMLTKHVGSGRDLLRHAFHSAYRMGDFTYAAYSLTELIPNFLIVGDHLDEVQAEAERAVEFAKAARVELAVDMLKSRVQIIRMLRGLTNDFGSFDDSEFDETGFEQHLANPASATAGFAYWTVKAEARFFVGDYASAADASLKAQELLWAEPTLLTQSTFRFYGALSHSTAWDSASVEEKQKHFKALTAHYKQQEIWAEHGPENFENRTALVGAEIARIEGRVVDAEGLYEKAIRSAHANGFIQNEAVAYEVAARFYAARGFDKIADAYLRESRYCYLRWGADGKVRQLDEFYPHLRKEARTRGTSSTIVARGELLDLATVIKVSQAVSGEMVFDKLIETLMRTAIEHAGAERGLLIRPLGDELQIEAEATIIGNDVTVHLRDASETVAMFPESVARYVARTRKDVIIDDAAAGNPFSGDPYIAQGRARSIACLPLVNQGRLNGIMLLENSLSAHVFTADRITVLNVLASQAAISLENTRLYRDLEQRLSEQKRTAEALQRSEAFLAEAQSISHTGSFGWNVLSGEIHWSEETYNIFQQDRSINPKLELILQRIHPDDRDFVQQTIDCASEARANLNFEHRLLMPDGSVKYLHVLARVSESSGNLEYVGAVTDVSERKRAEEALRRSEAYLAEAQRVTHTGSWASDGTTRGALYWSEEMFRIFGFDPQQGLPMRDQWLQRIHPEDRDRVKREASDKMFIQKVHSDVEFRIVLPDGTVKHIHGLAHPVFNSNRELVEVVGTAVDITEQKRAEEALKRSETYLAQAQRVAHIGSWVFDTVRMKPLYLSEEWYRLQNFDPKDGIPTWQQRLQRIHPEDRARYETAFNRAIAEKSDLDAEFRILLPHSNVRYIRSLGHPVLDACGHVTQLMGVVMDLTESRQAEQERERLQEELAHLAHRNRVSTMGELTASLAHEINQPIGAAVTNAQACLRFLNRDQPNVPEAREAALEMAKDARRAADIIARVRSLYQKGSSKLEMVDVNDLIREMVVMLRNEANRNSVAMRTELGEPLPHVMADRVQLQQVFMNLMLNAIEAMRDTSGELIIKSQLAEGGQLLLSVSDTGVGLPTGKADEIFEAFFTTKPQGTGLGLAITRSIVESHGGRVWAAANSRRGATFHFTLPHKAAAHA
jgi:PAS domain S-box-containing protein